jgi:RNA polymerase sigma-70 factor (ECF subfamily)
LDAGTHAFSPVCHKTLDSLLLWSVFGTIALRAMTASIITSDAELLNAAVGGDAEALRELLKRFGPRVRQTLRGKPGRKWQSILDEDDVMQVTYLEAFLHLDQLQTREPAGFQAWLARIAENVLRDACKALERQKRPNPSRRVANHTRDDSCALLLEQLVGGSLTPSRAAARLENGRLVLRAIENLPPDYGVAVEMMDLEGHSADEVAQKIGRSVGAVYMLRARAHARLRILLGPESQFFSRSA